MKRKYYEKEYSDTLSQKWITKKIGVRDMKLIFGFNVQMNFLYFDLYKNNGVPIKYHNRVVANLDYGGFFFTTEEPDTGTVCTMENVNDWQLIVKVD